MPPFIVGIGDGCTYHSNYHPSQPRHPVTCEVTMYAYAIILNFSTVYGPFVTDGAAVAYARANFAHNDWTVVTLVTPAAAEARL